MTERSLRARSFNKGSAASSTRPSNELSSLSGFISRIALYKSAPKRFSSSRVGSLRSQTLDISGLAQKASASAFALGLAFALSFAIAFSSNFTSAFGARSGSGRTEFSLISALVSGIFVSTFSAGAGLASGRTTVSADFLEFEATNVGAGAETGAGGGSGSPDPRRSASRAERCA